MTAARVRTTFAGAFDTEGVRCDGLHCRQRFGLGEPIIAVDVPGELRGVHRQTTDKYHPGCLALARDEAMRELREAAREVAKLGVEVRWRGGDMPTLVPPVLVEVGEQGGES